MNKSIARYLERRAVNGPWTLETAALEGIRQVVVIPAFAEYDHLFITLGDLAKNDPAWLARTLILCVVNNRERACVGCDAIDNNQRTLARLREQNAGREGLRLALIDAASPGRELPPKGGVGLARKIGLDAALAILARRDRPEGALISLDADTRLQANYLKVIGEFFAARKRWAAVINYAHPLEGDPEAVDAMACYELFLRYHRLGLAYAGSPYAFHTIGSTIACTARAYAAISGMNRRQAGEDFYFLQQLAKTGPVECIRETTVFPSSRVSKRVPFGTGARMAQHLEGEEKGYFLYHPESYAILRAWRRIVLDHLNDAARILSEKVEALCPALAAYLEAQGFEAAWTRLQQNHPQPEQRIQAWDGWFDGFRTLKAIHHLRDNGFPPQPIEEAIARLLRHIEPNSPPSPPIESGPAARLELLKTLRQKDRHNP